MHRSDPICEIDLHTLFSHLYADDAQLYKLFASDDINLAIEQVNKDLRAVCVWANENKLELNAEKSQGIIIGDMDLNVVPAVTLNGVELSFSKVVKNLGLIMNDRLTWNDHAAKISQRIFIGLRSLWPQSKSTPLKTRQLLAKALLLPHIDYCSPVFYYGLDAESKNDLNRSVKSIVRYVYGLGRFDSTESYLQRFLGCTLDTFLKVRSMCYIYKLAASTQPSYLRDFLVCGHSSRSVQYVVPRFDRAVGKKTIFVQGIIDWNLIPVRIRMASSLNVFRERCLEFFNRRSNLTIE